jgi:hypothetical protein
MDYRSGLTPRMLYLYSRAAINDFRQRKERDALIRRMQQEGEDLRLKFAKTNNTVKFVNNLGNENLRSKAVREARMTGYGNLNTIARSPNLQKTILNRLSKGGKKKTRKARRRT